MRALVLIAMLVACDKQGETVRPEEQPELTEDDRKLSDPETREEEKPSIDTTTKIEGGLTEAQVQATIDDHFRPVRECFDEALARMEAENLIGAIVVEFTVGGGGKVESAAVAASDFGDAEAGECIVGKLETWTFPKPKKGKATVRYAFLLRSY